MSKIIKSDEKIKNQKMEQEKKMHIKYNKLYMSREDRKNRVIRSERVKDFERSPKLYKINNRIKIIENMQKDKYLLEEERRKNEDEMNEKKNLMLKRLEQVIKSDKKNDKR